MVTQSESSTEHWELPTARSSYVVAVAPERAGLVLEGWGPSGRRTPWAPPRHKSFQTLLDVAPLEYAAAGTRHLAFSELLVQRPDGVDGVRLRLVDDGVQVRASGPTRHLTAVLRGDGDVEVTLHVVTSAEHDVVTRWAEITNLADDHELVLPRALSAGWNLPVGPGARLHALVGAWSREFTPVEVDLPAGQLRIGSRQGITSHQYSPVLAVQSRAGGADAFGVALAWCGSWCMVADAAPFRETVRVSAGVPDDGSAVTLGPGQRFRTPSMLGVWSGSGLTGLAQAWHEFQRGDLARSNGPEHRPVVYNSWYATRFDVRVEHQWALADRAARIGTEVFVVDDGWFTGRTSERAGLGDWFADESKFPDGLEALARGVLDRGMRFGLWVEPEAVNPDSDLYRQHPDWVYRAGERPLTTLRQQYVLDLGRPEVEQWAASMLRRLLSTYPITYLKWDMNRPVTDGGRPGDPRGREWSIQHAQAYLRLMAMLREEFPHVTVEACAGGGGRIDNAVLGVSDVVWPSDETGPWDRLAIQHGFLSAYPPSVMSSWVTDEPDRLDRAAASLELRFVVAMAGVLGVGVDLLAWDEATTAHAAELVALYREIRPVIHEGRVVRHREPTDDWYAVQYTAAHRVVVLVWSRGAHAVPPRISLAGLEPDARYRLQGTEQVLDSTTGTQVEVPFRLAADCDVLVLDRLDG